MRELLLGGWTRAGSNNKWMMSECEKRGERERGPKSGWAGMGAAEKRTNKTHIHMYNNKLGEEGRGRLLLLHLPSSGARALLPRHYSLFFRPAPLASGHTAHIVAVVVVVVPSTRRGDSFRL